ESSPSSVSDSSTLDVRLKEKGMHEPEGKTSPIAWVALISLWMLCSASSIMWLSFSVVSDISRQWLSVDLSAVNWIANATALMSVTEHGWLLVQSNRLNLPTWCQISYHYDRAVFDFCTTDYINYTSHYAAIPLGAAISQLAIPAICKSVEEFPRVVIVSAVYSTLAAAPFFFLPGLPKDAPSFTASSKRTPFLKACRALFKSVNFLLLMFMFSINLGLESSIVALLNPIMLPYGYTNEQAGIAGFVRLFSGFLAGAVTGPLIDRTGQHMLILRLFVPLLAFTYVMMYIQIIPNAILVVCMACVLNGFVTLLLLPTMLEIASEITYPVSESLSTSVLWAAAEIASFVMTLVMDLMKSGDKSTPPNNMQNALLFAMVLACVGTIPIVFFKGKMRRLAQDINFEQVTTKDDNEIED
ncbi:hypothetical protein INT43_006834, partial [Umbelopsis isabellina]